MSSEAVPPYLRIVADVRRRIADGELAPGDRIPSTRRLAAEWHVALATATKALTALRQEGLVVARPRVGTVVADPGAGPDGAGPAHGRDPDVAPPVRRPRVGARAGEGELTRDRVVRAAVTLADDEGLAALSMRAVAARLGVAVMSPYRYVTGKESLVLLMADAVHGELRYPVDAPPRWRERAEAGGMALWHLHRRHPWLAQLAPPTRPLTLPNLVRYSDWMLAPLVGSALGPVAMMDLNVLLHSYVQGVAVHLERERHVEAASAPTGEQWLDTQAPALEALLDADRYPAFTYVVRSFGEDGYDLDLDEVFRLGLTSMLDGLAPLVEGRTRRR